MGEWIKERIANTPPGDLFVFFLVAVCLLVALYTVIRGAGVDSRSKHLWFTGLIAASALVLRFILLMVPEGYFGSVPEQVLLAIASGSIASLLILWATKQEPQPPAIEDSSYHVTWTFLDYKLAGRVQMKWQLVQERTNRSTKAHLGWESTWFEPYPGIESVESPSVRVAEKEVDLYPTNPRGQCKELPLVTNGFVISLDKSKSSEAQPAYLKSDETKWFKVEATMIVPIAYRDTAVGQVALGKPPRFEMKDETTSGLALFLAGPSNELALNFDEKGKIISKKVEISHSQVTERPTRAQAYWYPKALLKKSTKKLILERFKPKDQ